MHLDNVDHDNAPTTPSRRALLAGTAAGVVGATVLLSNSASAAPLRPSESDVASLTAAMQFELAVYNLYKAASESLREEDRFLADTMAKSHEAFAEGIASLTGIAADTMNEDFFDANEAAFAAGSLSGLAGIAYDIESAAITTHTELLGTYENIDALELVASIITAEARHAAILADVAGLGENVDALLVNSASALDLAGGAA